MSIVKSFSCGLGDMFYIQHGSDNFTVIDCSLSDDSCDDIISEVKRQSKSKSVVRFISTHPDQDHLSGLVKLDDAMNFLNFYCVKNSAAKDEPTVDFERYCELRDHSKKAFHLFRDCTRRWMNEASEERKSAGISILWPVTSNAAFKEALAQAEAGESPNNISCIVKYSLEGGVSIIWMGDLETNFMEEVQDSITLPKVDILFAPHHGRDSGKVPDKWLSEMNPKVVVIGEAPSTHLSYYGDYSTITQNSAGDIVFDCLQGSVHVYVGSDTYSVDFLDNDDLSDKHGAYYLGTLSV